MNSTSEADKIVLVKTVTSFVLEKLDWKHKKHSLLCEWKCFGYVSFSFLNFNGIFELTSQSFLWS